VDEEKTEQADSESPHDATQPPSIDRELDLFVQHLEALATSFPLVTDAMSTALETAGKSLNRLIQDFSQVNQQSGDTKTFNVPPLQIRELMRLIRHYGNARIASDILPLSLVVSLVSQYDFFLSRLLRCLFYLRPETLNASDRHLTFSSLLQFDSIQAVKDYLIEKEIETVLRMSHAEQFAWLELRFAIPLRKNLFVWPTFIEVTERRNLFVHTNGVVSSQYLAVCREHNVVFEHIPKVGDRLPVSTEYFQSAYRCLFEIGVKLAQVLWRKLFPGDIEKADTSVTTVIYELLCAERYDLAVTIGDFVFDTIKKLANDRTRRMLLVNRAQAYKWAGNAARCHELIEKEDWTACGEDFQLAHDVLKDDFESASKRMKKIGAGGLMQEHDYKDWPLFREFRNSEVFQHTYKEVFGHAFSIQKQSEEANGDVVSNSPAPPTEGN